MLTRLTALSVVGNPLAPPFSTVAAANGSIALVAFCNKVRR
jgi:hypothetical protein